MSIKRLRDFFFIKLNGHARNWVSQRHKTCVWVVSTAAIFLIFSKTKIRLRQSILIGGLPVQIPSNKRLNFGT